MTDYLIKNGHIFDPLQGIKGDRKDIGIKDGQIVDASAVSSSASSSAPRRSSAWPRSCAAKPSGSSRS